MTKTAILDGIRVLSLEQVHVLPWGTGFLADFGAEVIRVESLDHMNDRHGGPFPDKVVGEEWWNEGGTFTYWNRNKESICLEVADPKGKEVFLRLIKNCDIVTDNFRPGTMRRLGFDHESLAKINPKIITCSVTAYGHTGSWRQAGARARTVDASSGLTYLCGFEDGPAQRASPNYLDHTGGNNAAFAMLLAIYRMRKTGKGSRIDLSMQETGTQSIGPAILEAQEGYVRKRIDTGHMWKAPHHVYPCKGEDRWVAITCSDDEEWKRLKAAMGNPQWATDSAFDNAPGRLARRQEIDALIAEWTAPWDNVEVTHHLQKAGVTAGAALDGKQLWGDPHLNARGYYDNFDNKFQPQVGPRKYAGRPFRIPNIPVSLHQSPNLGQQNTKVLKEMGGLTEGEIEQLVELGIINTRPRPTEETPLGSSGAWGG